MGHELSPQKPRLKVDGKLPVLLGHFQRFIRLYVSQVATAGSENALNKSRLLFAAFLLSENVMSRSFSCYVKPRNVMTLLTGFTRICPFSTLFAGGLRFGLTTHHHSTSRLLAKMRFCE